MINFNKRNTFDCAKLVKKHLYCMGKNELRQICETLIDSAEDELNLGTRLKFVDMMARVRKETRARIDAEEKIDDLKAENSHLQKQQAGVFGKAMHEYSEKMGLHKPKKNGGKIPTDLNRELYKNPIKFAVRMENGIPFIYDIESGRPISGIFAESIDFSMNKALSATVEFYLERCDDE